MNVTTGSGAFAGVKSGFNNNNKGKEKNEVLKYVSKKVEPVYDPKKEEKEILKNSLFGGISAKTNIPTNNSQQNPNANNKNTINTLNQASSKNNISKNEFNGIDDFLNSNNSNNSNANINNNTNNPSKSNTNLNNSNVYNNNNNNNINTNKNSDNLFDEIFSTKPQTQTGINNINNNNNNNNNNINNILDFNSLSLNNNNSSNNQKSTLANPTKNTQSVNNNNDFFNMMSSSTSSHNNLNISNNQNNSTNISNEISPMNIDTDSFGEFWTNSPIDEISCDYVSKNINTPEKFFNQMKTKANFFPVDIINNEAICAAKFRGKIVLIHATISGFNINVLIKCYDSSHFDSIKNLLKNII
jgi:hypothetical protein